jgi:hypothetical protein
MRSGTIRYFPEPRDDGGDCAAARNWDHEVGRRRTCQFRQRWRIRCSRQMAHGGLQRDFLAILGSISSLKRDRDPVIDPRRPAIVPDPRSGSIDPGSWNEASTPFPATMSRPSCLFVIPLQIDLSWPLSDVSTKIYLLY